MDRETFVVEYVIHEHRQMQVFPRSRRVRPRVNLTKDQLISGLNDGSLVYHRHGEFSATITRLGSAEVLATIGCDEQICDAPAPCEFSAGEEE